MINITFDQMSHIKGLLEELDGKWWTTLRIDGYIEHTYNKSHLSDLSFLEAEEFILVLEDRLIEKDDMKQKKREERKASKTTKVSRRSKERSIE